MGSYVMHLAISSVVRRKLKLGNSFLKGSILPDILKEKNNDKIHTHYLINKEINGQSLNVPDVLKAIDELELNNQEIKLGYIAHLVEDYIWFARYIPKIARKTGENTVMFLMDKKEHDVKEFSKITYKEYYSSNKYLMDKYHIFREDVINYLKDDFEKTEIECVICNIRCIGNLKDNQFITKELLDEYIDESSKEVYRIIKGLLKGEVKWEV